MQKYRFVEGVDEAWMEYADRAERAHEAEQTAGHFGFGPDMYLASEVDAVFAQLRELVTTEHESKADFIARVRAVLTKL